MGRAGFIFAYAVLVVCLPMLFVISQFSSAASFEQKIAALAGTLAVVVFLNITAMTILAVSIENRARKLTQARLPVKQPIYLQDYVESDYASVFTERASVFTEHASSAVPTARTARRSRRY